MRKAIFIIGAFILLSQLSLQDAYKAMLETLYSHTVPVIQVNDFSQIKEKVTLIDTRSPEEYKTSRIKGAEFINYDDFDIGKIENYDKNDTIVFYCSVGYRSEKIAEKFQDSGFENVYNLYGGIFDWVNKGNDVVNEEGQPTDSIHAYNYKWSVWLQKGIKVYD